MPVRKRRTAEESRSLILDTAARRLREHGLEGLNITGVAEEAGISHATLIHHFGSSGGMRSALADKMTMDLLHDLLRAFDARVPTAELTRNVFSALAEGGHARLIAWRAVEGKLDPNENFGELEKAFQKLLQSVQDAVGVDRKEDVQRLVMLVAMAAIGYGLAGEVLARALGMNEEALADFPQWVTEWIA